MFRTYCIIGRTNGWIAQRDIAFNGKSEVIFKKGLSLKEARKILLDWFNDDYDLGCRNLGSAMNSKAGQDYLCRYSDGTYSYQWDSRYYVIEEEDSWTYNYLVELNGQPVESGEVTFHYEDDEKAFVERMTEKYEEDSTDSVEVLFR